MQICDVKSRHPEARDWYALYKVTNDSVGLTAFIAVHSVQRGPGFGGIRRMPYADADSALADALRLSEHMTLKTALANLPCGGAKTVIMDHGDLNADEAYRVIGEAVQGLDGLYYCGPDIGTGETEMATVREHTQFANPIGNNPSQSTAQGVLAAIDAIIDTPPSRSPTVLVQGVGRVGQIVALGCAQFCASLAVSDVSDDAVEHVRSRVDAAVIHPNAILTQSYDLFSPCAVGPVVTAKNAGSLPFKMICGSANNQLAHPNLAQTLHDRGVVYAPDVIVNAGAVIEGALSLLEPGPGNTQRINEAIQAIGPRIGTLVAQSKETGRSPLDIAMATAAIG